uniref:Uncharacterized protein n=1 Tax=Oncorhynchus kisutch TaxID=8019 RepID=A0A8C7L1U9_ONCKI
MILQRLTVDYERGVVSLKLTSTEEVNEVVAHIGICLQRICPGLSPLKLMKKLSMEPPERITSLQTLWDNHKVAEPGPCGGFSQIEEVQWDVDTIYLTQDTRDLSLQDFSHLENSSNNRLEASKGGWCLESLFFLCQPWLPAWNTCRHHCFAQKELHRQGYCCSKIAPNSTIYRIIENFKESG